MDQPGTPGVAARLLKRPGSQYETPPSSAYAAASDNNPNAAIATPIAEQISRPPDFRSEMQRVICSSPYLESQLTNQRLNVSRQGSDL
jgi:hypothetical protein